MKTNTEKTAEEIKYELIAAIAKACEAKTALTARVATLTVELPEFAASESAKANVRALQLQLSKIGRMTARRVVYLSNARLCHAWNALTNPYKLRTEKAHKLASDAARIVRAEIDRKGFAIVEFSNGAIFPK